MTMEFATVAQDVMDQVAREKRRRAILASILIVWLLALLVTAAVFFVNFRADAARQESLDDLKGLCEDGIIDCRGHQGLPGPRGRVGGTVTSVDCTGGQFVFKISNGETFKVGDCIAERGRPGARGPRGRTGAHGPQGPRGPRGFQGHRGKPGKHGPAMNLHGIKLPNLPVD